MRRWSGGLVALGIATIVAMIAACSSFGTGPGGVSGSNDGGGVNDGAPVNPVGGDAGTVDGEAGPVCDVAACGPGCTKYNFTPSACPPADWRFGGNATGKECVGNRIHLFAEGTNDATAELVTQPPAGLTGAHIELRLLIRRWAGLNAGTRARVLIVGGKQGTAVAITAIENPLRNYDLQLCRIDDSGNRQNCIDFTAITANVEHVVSFDWSDLGLTATIDCTIKATQPTIPIAGSQNFGLIFGMNDANPIDGTIGDVSVTFR